MALQENCLLYIGLAVCDEENEKLCLGSILLESKHIPSGRNTRHRSQSGWICLFPTYIGDVMINAKSAHGTDKTAKEINNAHNQFEAFTKLSRCYIRAS